MLSGGKTPLLCAFKGYRTGHAGLRQLQTPSTIEIKIHFSQSQWPWRVGCVRLNIQCVTYSNKLLWTIQSNIIADHCGSFLRGRLAFFTLPSSPSSWLPRTQTSNAERRNDSSDYYVDTRFCSSIRLGRQKPKMTWSLRPSQQSLALNPLRQVVKISETSGEEVHPLVNSPLNGGRLLRCQGKEDTDNPISISTTPRHSTTSTLQPSRHPQSKERR